MPPDPPSFGPSRHDIALLTCLPKLKSVPPPLRLICFSFVGKLHIILLYGLNNLFYSSICTISKCGKCHTVLDDYSALAIVCMLQLLTAVWLQLLCSVITQLADIIPQQSCIVVTISSPANIGVCMGWGRWKIWIIRHEPEWGNVGTHLLTKKHAMWSKPTLDIDSQCHFHRLFFNILVWFLRGAQI